MFRTWKIGMATAILAILFSCQSTPAAEQAGYVLVDRLVTLFNKMATSPDVSYSQINSGISAMMTDARLAKSEQRLDQQFFDRYSRILRVIKLVIIDDESEILQPISGPECAAFVKDVTGQKVEGSVHANLAVTAQAITKELENLKKYLDQKKGK